MRQLVPLLSVLVLCVAIPAQERRSRGRTEGAQQQQPQTEVQPEDYARLEGTVYDANTGAPLAKARISMYGIGSRSRDRLAVTTDADGRFLFSKVEPGQYRLSAGRNRYATQSYGAEAPGRPGTPLTIAPGTYVKDIAFKLLPAAVVTGRVVDEDGEPAVYVQVQTLKYRYIGSRRELTPTGPAATTNDLGEYRLFGVSPGKYYVAATYRERFSRESMMGMSAVEQDSTYPTVYYPGVLDVSQTAPIVLRAGEERSSVDFSLMRVRAVRVKGKVVTGAGVAAPAGTTVNLMPKDAKSFTGMFHRFNSVDRRTGTFEMKGVQPGSYVLTAMTRRGRERLYARQDIEVGGTNVEGVVLVLGPGIKLSGSVELEGEAPAGVALENMRVYTQPTESRII